MRERGVGYLHKTKRKATLFVSDIDADAIRLFPANKKNPKQKGSITAGIDVPVNAAVDTHGTLYVANNGNSTVTEYPFGKTSPERDAKRRAARLSQRHRGRQQRYGLRD